MNKVETTQMVEISSGIPFIRPCDPEKDADAVHHICQATLPPALQDERAFSIAPYIWANPYIQLCPKDCFVIDSSTGTAVGYIVGTPNTKDYIKRYRAEYIPTLDAEKFPEPSIDVPADWRGDLPEALLQHLYMPEELLHADFPQLIDEYPAHLHIDLLPKYQRKGLGRQLMHVFWEKLRDDGVKGIHLIMATENPNGLFYERLGFTRFPFVLDGGVSGEKGRHPGGIWLVKKLE